MVTTSKGDDDFCWYLDTGCLNLMTRNKEWLINLDPSMKSNIRFIDNSTIIVKGIERVQLNCKNGKMAYMNDVPYVPSMKNNLLNLGQLLEKSYTMSMQEN